MQASESSGAEAIDRWAIQVRKGSLELAIMAALWSGRLYGLEILRRLGEGSGLVVAEGTIYPLLSRLKHEGWVDAEWVAAEAGHPRKYFSLTPSGRAHVAALARAWTELAASLDHLLLPLREEEPR